MKKKVNARQVQKDARQEKEGKKVVEWIFGVLEIGRASCRGRV